MSYTVKQQGEWSGNGALDLDFEAETLADVDRIVDREIEPGTYYEVVDETGVCVKEGTR